MKARARRILIATLVAVVLVLLAGATYQGVATALERREYPHPGRLVDAGGHQLHIYCTGDGVPVVVLEAPAAGMSAAWGWVQPAVAERTRVCSYDRGALGWSESGERPYDPGRVPDELHALLANANERPPFVMVGHSLGAAFLRVYASRYQPVVAGLVLIDPPEAATDAAPDPRLLTLSPWLARTGVLRATRLLAGNARGLPEPSAGAVRTFLNRPDHLTRAARELQRWDDAVHLSEEARVPDVPVDVLHLGDGNRLPLINNAEAAGKVTAAILQLVEATRSKRAVKTRPTNP